MIAATLTQQILEAYMGFVILMNREVIHYKSKQSPMVCLSSTESEFVALAMSIKKLKCFINILRELQLKIVKKIVFCDNQGALRIATNYDGGKRTKHVDIRYQHTKTEFKAENIQVRYVHTSDQVADIFNKPLGRVNFEKLRTQVLASVPEVANNRNKGEC